MDMTAAVTDREFGFYDAGGEAREDVENV